MCRSGVCSHVQERSEKPGGRCSHEEEWSSHTRGGVEYATLVEKRSMQPCRAFEYATMRRSGVFSPVPDWRSGVGTIWRSELCSHVQEWRMRPCRGVEYATISFGGGEYEVMCRSGEYSHVKEWSMQSCAGVE